VREKFFEDVLATSVITAVPKVGIEPSSPHTHQQETATNRTVGGAANAPDSAPKCVIRGGVDDSLDDSADDSREWQGSDGRLPADALVGVVETALARALTLAAEAGRWEIVTQLAEELAARQRTRDERPGIVRRDGVGKREVR
jgi:hypothetical protein